ncbi:MAG TPA: hypothetical protein VIU62_23710 [Chloroflexota bacterium]
MIAEGHDGSIRYSDQLYRDTSDPAFLDTDPLERRNLADGPELQTVRAQLHEELERRRRETADPLLQGEIPAPPEARLTALDTYGGDEAA